MNYYIEQIKHFPLLDREQEIHIATKALSGDDKARQKLITSNLLLVIKIANEYRSIYNNINDLIQEGNVGLIKAVSKYDPTRGFRFSTYANWWIRCLILRHILTNSHMINIATTTEQKKLFYNLRKEQRKLAEKGGIADLDSIAQTLQVSPENAIEMDKRLQADVYVDIGDVEIAGLDSDIESNNFNYTLRTEIQSFGDRLGERDRVILFERIVAEEPKTLQELSVELSVSRERIRQLETIIKFRLKKHLIPFVRNNY